MSLEVPLAPEMNLYFFFKQLAPQVNELQTEILEHLVAAGTSRGWFPTLPAVINRFSENDPEETVRAAIAGLHRLRLLQTNDEGGIQRIIGGITHEKTRFRAVTQDNVPFHLCGVIDVFTAAGMLQKSLSVQTRCGVSDQKIEIEFDRDGSIASSIPSSITAFLPGWDGESHFSETDDGSHFFSDNAQLRSWQDANEVPEGLPLSEDTILLIGTEMAKALSDLYIQMSVR
jgi:hypothetical protein